MSLVRGYFYIMNQLITGITVNDTHSSGAECTIRWPW